VGFTLVDGIWYPQRGIFKPSKWRSQAEKFREFGGKIAIDCGACVGLVSRVIADNFEEVHAFEPDPDNYRALVRNTWEKYNVFTYNVALSDKPGWCSMRGASSTSRYVDDGTEIEKITLDEFNLKADLVKIDVEGHEYYLIQGAKRTLSSGPVVAVEDKGHWKRMAPMGGVEALKSLGYRVTKELKPDVITTR